MHVCMKFRTCHWSSNCCQCARSCCVGNFQLDVQATYCSFEAYLHQHQVVVQTRCLHLPMLVNAEQQFLQKLLASSVGLASHANFGVSFHVICPLVATPGTATGVKLYACGVSRDTSTSSRTSSYSSNILPNH